MSGIRRLLDSSFASTSSTMQPPGQADQFAARAKKSTAPASLAGLPTSLKRQIVQNLAGGGKSWTDYQPVAALSRTSKEFAQLVEEDPDVLRMRRDGKRAQEMFLAYRPVTAIARHLHSDTFRTLTEIRTLQLQKLGANIGYVHPVAVSQELDDVISGPDPEDNARLLSGWASCLKGLEAPLRGRILDALISALPREPERAWIHWQAMLFARAVFSDLSSFDAAQAEHLLEDLLARPPNVYRQVAREISLDLRQASEPLIERFTDLVFTTNFTVKFDYLKRVGMHFCALANLPHNGTDRLTTFLARTATPSAPDGIPLDRALSHALQAGLKYGQHEAVSKLICLAQSDEVMSRPTASILAADGEGRAPGLMMALWNGHQQTVSLYAQAVLGSNLTSLQKRDVLTWPTYGSELRRAVQNGHTETAFVFLKAVLNSNLDPAHKQDLFRPVKDLAVFKEFMKRCRPLQTPTTRLSLPELMSSFISASKLGYAQAAFAFQSLYNWFRPEHG